MQTFSQHHDVTVFYLITTGGFFFSADFCWPSGNLWLESKTHKDLQHRKHMIIIVLIITVIKTGVWLTQNQDMWDRNGPKHRAGLWWFRSRFAYYLTKNTAAVIDEDSQALRFSFVDLSQWQKWTQREYRLLWTSRRHLVEQKCTLQFDCRANTSVSCTVSWLELKHTTLWAPECNRMFYAGPPSHDSLGVRFQVMLRKWLSHHEEPPTKHLFMPMSCVRTQFPQTTVKWERAKAAAT